MNATGIRACRSTGMRVLPAGVGTITTVVIETTITHDYLVNYLVSWAFQFITMSTS